MSKQGELTDEEAEREFEEADRAFKEEDDLSGTEIQGEDKGEGKGNKKATEEESKEEKAHRYQNILIALGFTRYDNQEKGISCKLKAGALQIGRTFNEKYPVGNMWVKCLSDCEYGKKEEFLKKDKCKQISQVALFYRIRDGELPIPEPTINGKVVGKSEKAVQIQFDEFGETRTEWWGFKAVYSSEEGIKYVPASYSKQTENYNAKMQVPRDITLENYEAELKEAPLTTQTGDDEHKEEHKEKVEKGALADKIPISEPETREKTIANKMKLYLEKGREMVEQIFPELEQPQLSELSQDIATSLFIEDCKESRRERY